MPTQLLAGEPSTVAVVCIECQNGVLGTDSVLPNLAEHCVGLVAEIRRLLDAARDAGAHVVHATYERLAGTVPAGTARLWRALGPATAEWAPGSVETQVIPELLAPTDLVLPRHQGLFPTMGTELLPTLRDLGVQTVILAGVSLNLAVLFSAGHATQEGFRLVVPRDAVGGTPAEYAEQVLEHSIAMLGRVTTVDALVDEWATQGRAVEPAR
jgi:nicotinamidase-related amidase